MSSITPPSNNVSFNNPCYGDSSIFTISNTSVDSVLWDFGDPNSGLNNISNNINPSHLFSDTGNFVITLYSYFNGMIDTVINDLFVTDIPIVNLGYDTIICDGEILTLDASAQNATYLWQDNSTNPTYTVSVEGDYFVDVTVNGCANSDTIHVNYNFLPEAIISGDYEICYGDQADIEIIVNGSSPFEITYTNGADTNVVYGNDSIIIEDIQSGIYEITNVTDQFGCIGSYSGSADISIKICSLSVYVPNAFTPNVDAYNQVFMPSIYDIDNVVNYNMTIFNRWGEIIFETNEVGIYWDGKFNNTIVQEGIYAYTITITDIFEKLYDFNGYIYLIR
jgi:gliding motility-associated-like protein